MSPSLQGVPRSWLTGPSTEVAPRLLNRLLVAADGRAGRIIEVEAYAGSADPASHAFKGQTPRNRTMFGPPGHLYVYFSYGVHWCANVVTGAEGVGQAVLLRALAPVAGLEAMRAARWRTQRHQVDRDLCRGPGRLCQAMGIERHSDGVDLCRRDSPLRLVSDGVEPPPCPDVSPRIGISVATDRLWRFTVPGHRGVSGPSARSAGSGQSAGPARSAGPGRSAQDAGDPGDPGEAGEAG